MQRRNILGALLFGASSPFALASNPENDANKKLSEKPYDVIKKPIASDNNIVRLLFSYDCPYCRSYHHGLVKWGESLPSPLAFKATPILTSDSDNLILAIYGRLLMEAIAPKKVDSYDYSMYVHIQGDPDSGQIAKARISSEDVMRTIMSSSGLSGDEIADKLGKISSSLEKRIPLHAEIINQYELHATPTVAIGGRVTINPDHTGGDPQQYLLLLNAMVSKLIQGGLNGV